MNIIENHENNEYDKNEDVINASFASDGMSDQQENIRPSTASLHITNEYASVEPNQEHRRSDQLDTMVVIE